MVILTFRNLRGYLLPVNQHYKNLAKVNNNLTEKLDFNVMSRFIIRLENHSAMSNFGGEKMMKQITIGKLSKISGVSPRTIRHYGDIGLLQCAAKTETNYRLYGEEEVRRLEKILLFKNLGFSLDDIYTILFTEENQQVGELFEKRLEDFERQMSEISRYQELLKGIINIYRSYGLEYVDNYHLIKELVGMNNLFVKTFNRLDLELQINVLKEIYHTGSLTPLTLNEIGVESGSQLLRELHLIVVKVLLNKVDRNIERDIILSLEKDDPEFAAEVKKAMFTFEDIIILPDSTIEKWLVLTIFQWYYRVR